MFLAEGGGPFGAAHALAHFRELGRVHLVARFPLLQLAFDLRQPLGRMFGIGELRGQLVCLRLPAGRFLAAVRDRALQFGGALLRGPDLTRGRQADGSEERVQKTQAVKRF